jgi:hypothetical protein
LNQLFLPFLLWCWRRSLSLSATFPNSVPRSDFNSWYSSWRTVGLPSRVQLIELFPKHGWTVFQNPRSLPSNFDDRLSLELLNKLNPNWFLVKQFKIFIEAWALRKFIFWEQISRSELKLRVKFMFLSPPNLELTKLWELLRVNQRNSQKLTSADVTMKTGQKKWIFTAFNFWFHWNR